MRLFVIAALLALPLLGLGAQSASADYYCCGKGQEYPHHYARIYYVPQDTAVYDCDARHCETRIKLLAGSHIKAKCRPYGWCEVIGSVGAGGDECKHHGCGDGREITKVRFANMWVPEYCLKPYGYGEGYRNDDEGGEGDNRD